MYLIDLRKYFMKRCKRLLFSKFYFMYCVFKYVRNFDYRVQFLCYDFGYIDRFEVFNILFWLQIYIKNVY